MQSKRHGMLSCEILILHAIVQLRNSVSNWLKLQAAAFFEEGMKKLVKCCEKCGNFVEK